MTSLWFPGTENTILVATSRVHHVKNFPGPLSIKTVTGGRVAWKTGNRNIWVDQSSFLVLNDGEPYSMAIESPEPVSTFCVFFQKGFVESLRESLDGRELYSVPSSLHPRSAEIAGKMARLRAHVLNHSPAIQLDECYVDLAAELLLHNKDTARRIRRIPAMGAATREELFVRVARGREFLHAEACRKVTLAEAARAACLSPYHFHRTFTKLFGTTPSRYLSNLKLQEAARLLTRGYTVTGACFAVGFESLSSFSVSFSKRFGTQPANFRKRN